MAKCDEGYRCEICGEDVEDIRQSDLYLRFVIGMVDPETLHTQPERHIGCNPALAQFIVDEAFELVVVEGDFDKRRLDPAYVAQREELVTRGWLRLVDLFQTSRELPISEYPLREVCARWQEKP